MSDADHRVITKAANKRSLHEGISGHMLEAVANTVPDMLYVVGAEGHLTFWNKSLVATTGYCADEIATMQATSFFVEEDRPRVAEAIVRCRREGNASVDAYVLTKNGERIPFGFASSVLRDGDGNPTAICGVGRNLSERKQNAAKLNYINRALLAVRKVNQLLVHERDRTRLVQEACRCLAEERGCGDAWIILIDGYGQVELRVQSGLDNAYEPVAKHLNDGRLPACMRRVVKRSGVVITRSTDREANDCPIQTVCANESRLTASLVYGTRVYGLLCVSVPPDLEVDDEECDLIGELAGDIAFALHVIETEDEQKQTVHQLHERVKEMRCLIGLSKLVEQSNADLTVILSELPSLLVQAWQYSEAAVARVYLGGNMYASEGFEETIWRLVAPITVNDRLAGSIEVCYVSKVPDSDKGPFLEQERHLLEAVAERIGRVAERAHTADALYESEERFRTITSAANDAIVMTDECGNIVFWNAAAERMFGYSNADAIGANAARLLAGDFERVFQIAVPESNVFRGSDAVEFAVACEGGRVVPVECSSSAVTLSRGWCAVSILRDITDRKRMEEEQARDLQRMESQLELNHMDDRCLREIITYTVEESIRLTGSTIGYLAVMNDDETVLTMQYWSKSAHADCAMVEKPIVYPIEKTGLWGEAVRQRKPVVTNNYLAPNPHKRGLPQGHVRIVRHMNIPVFDGERIVAVAGVGNKSSDYDDRDVRQLQLFMEGWRQIVERRRVSEILIEARRSAESAMRTKSEFLANMSHEIRTPMTAILGYVDILLEELNDADMRDTADTIKRNAEHLLAIINDILDISKMEAGRLKIEADRCSPRDIVSSVAELLEVLAEKKGLELKQEYEGPLPGTILTDPVRLYQILTNIVGNAVKFTESGSVRIITRMVERDNDTTQIQFDVIDTGIGISATDLGKLFEPFTQADGSSTRRFEGTGLGLAISRRLAQMLGGDIQVESELERGSMFRVSIATGALDGIELTCPSEDSVSPNVRSSKPSTELRKQLDCRVLVVDDSTDNQRLIANDVRAAGSDSLTEGEKP